jgi:hypothetical protein
LGNPCPAKGWRLREAVREISPQELWNALNEAECAVNAAEQCYNATPCWFDDGDPAKKNHAQAARDARRHQRDACANAIWHFLRDELIADRLLAEGIPDNPNAAPIRIRPVCWQHIRVADWDAAVVKMTGNPPITFFDVRIFEQPSRAAERRVRLTSKAADDCRKWLIGLMRTSPNMKPLSKAEYRRQAMDKFPELSIRSFEVAWKNACETTGANWNAAGRPKKSPR